MRELAEKVRVFKLNTVRTCTFVQSPWLEKMLKILLSEIFTKLMLNVGVQEFLPKSLKNQDTLSEGNTISQTFGVIERQQY